MNIRNPPKTANVKVSIPYLADTTMSSRQYETNYQSHHWHLRNSQTALLAMPINYWMATQIQTCYLFKALHTGHPSYFANVSQYHKSAKSTRSSASQFIGKTFHLVLVHFIQGHQRSRTPYLLTLCIAKHSLISFTRHLKTFRFQLAYPAHSAHPQCATILFRAVGGAI